MRAVAAPTRLGTALLQQTAATSRPKLMARPVCAAHKAVPKHHPLQGVHGDKVLVREGKQYVPLSEAQRFFEAGIRTGATERIEMLEAELQQVMAERDEMAAALDDEYTVHEREMKKLLGVALALEAELVKRTQDLDMAAEAAVEEAQERMAAAFQAKLEVLHQQDVEAVEDSMHERIEGMGHALRTALAGKESWRHRALESEKQLTELRAQIQSKWEGAQQGAKRAQAAPKAKFMGADAD